MTSNIEYASYSIKPSQYKQIGEFIPLNHLNNKPLADITTTLGTLKSNKRVTASNNKHLTQFNFMKQFRYFKDDLELLIQRFRNLQKHKYSSLNDLKQFINAIEDFNLKLITLTNMNVTEENCANVDNVVEVTNGSSVTNYKFNSNEIIKTFTKLKEYQLKINYLIEQLNLNSNDAVNIINSNETEILDAYMDQLYKIFNECLHLIVIIPNR